jgi:hypothetical protein
MGQPSKAGCDAIKALAYFLIHHAAGMVREKEPAVRVVDFGMSIDPQFVERAWWN